MLTERLQTITPLQKSLRGWTSEVPVANLFPLNVMLLLLHTVTLLHLRNVLYSVNYYTLCYMEHNCITSLTYYKTDDMTPNMENPVMFPYKVEHDEKTERRQMLFSKH